MSSATTTPSNVGTTVTQCGSFRNAPPAIPHNDPLHIIALFVILSVSTGAAMFPIIATRNPRLRIPSKLLFILKHFGTGVLVATAFCHLLPTAFISLLDPCLQSVSPVTGQPDGKGVLGLGGSYPALSGAIAMAGVFIVATVEMIFAEVVGGNERHHHHRSNLADGVTRSSTFGKEKDATTTNRPNEIGLSADISPSGSATPAMGGPTSRAETMVGKDELCEDPELASNPSDFIVLEKEREKQKKAILQCFLLELGILFHSVFIGLALSVSAGKDFVVLFIAIVFHQTFEGLSLGTRIAFLKFQRNEKNSQMLPSTQTKPTIGWRLLQHFHIPHTLKPYLMALTYGLTTPLGQSIGLGLLFSPASNYDPTGKTELILVGSANAISSGLLLWAGLVELLSADFFGEERAVGIMADKRWRWAAWLAVFCGAASMATVGAWA